MSADKKDDKHHPSNNSLENLFGLKRIARHTVITAAAAVAIDFLYGAAFNGTLINNTLSYAAASFIGSMVDGMITGKGIEMSSLIRPTLNMAVISGLVTFILPMIPLAFAKDIVNPPNSFYLIGFVMVTQLLSDILYKYTKY